jgi:hypothetical protein
MNPNRRMYLSSQTSIPKAHDRVKLEVIASFSLRHALLQNNLLMAQRFCHYWCGIVMPSILRHCYIVMVVWHGTSSLPRILMAWSRSHATVSCVWWRAGPRHYHFLRRRSMLVQHQSVFYFRHRSRAGIRF